jgi:hypothetical protein
VNAAVAGVLYFAVAFALGFLLGTLRVLVIMPWLGPVAAVLLELPIMLIASWVAAGRLVGRCRVPASAFDRLVMGAVAFALLMAGEFAVSHTMFDRTPAQHLATYRTPEAQLGLAAQLVFALFPWLLLRIRAGQPRR